MSSSNLSALWVTNNLQTATLLITTYHPQFLILRPYIYTYMHTYIPPLPLAYDSFSHNPRKLSSWQQLQKTELKPRHHLSWCCVFLTKFTIYRIGEGHRFSEPLNPSFSETWKSLKFHIKVSCRQHLHIHPYSLTTSLRSCYPIGFLDPLHL